MDFFTLAIIVFTAIYLLKAQQQRRHTRLLAEYLGRFQIEKLMGGLIEGYMRAVGETDAQRRAQIWTVLDNTEASLVEQLQRFAKEFSAAEPELTRVNTLPLALPYLDRVFPKASFDMREAVQLHVRGIAAVRVSESASDDERRARAFMMTAELLLLQYSCHWFCKSRAIAAVRLMARQKTPYEQVLASVSAQTRNAYQQLIA